MRAPRRKRPLPRSITVPPDQVILKEIASRVRYVGSAEHKDHPSFAGHPRPRADATLCDRALAIRQNDLTASLRDAVLAGSCGTWDVDSVFPRYVWCDFEGKMYEARLTNRESGEYKGYELSPEEFPDDLRDHG